MIGAIAGDIVGSVFEAAPIKHRDFILFSADSGFTDDTVLTVATADTLLTGGNYAERYRHWFRRHPDAGYGAGFRRWAEGTAGAYGSFGNGAAMRVAPVGWAMETLEAVYAEAKRSASVSHNHPEGIKGAQAIAVAVFLARNGEGKATIRRHLAHAFGYDLGRRLDAIRPAYQPDVTSAGSVPEALIAFFESEDYEDALRNAVSLGGDADTQACIAGSVAEAFYGGVPAEIRSEAFCRLTPDLLAVTDRFMQTYRIPQP